YGIRRGRIIIVNANGIEPESGCGVIMHSAPASVHTACDYRAFHVNADGASRVIIQMRYRLRFRVRMYVRPLAHAN
ncbi:hypothetical protein EVAR_89152_1, partial [Eumeta japonica]